MDGLHPNAKHKKTRSKQQEMMSHGSSEAKSASEYKSDGSPSNLPHNRRTDAGSAEYMQKPAVAEASSSATAAAASASAAPALGGGGASPSSASSAPPAVKKRPRNEEFGPDDVDIDPAKLATMSRSERKRFREKKRRSDVNKGFDDLMNLLIEIDPEVRAEAEERARRGQWKGTMGAQEDNLLSRVDLIGRTVSVLRRLNQENEQRKLIVERLLQELSARGEAGSQQVRADQSLAIHDVSAALPSLSADNDSLAARIAAARAQIYQPSALSQLAAGHGPGSVESLLAIQSHNPFGGGVGPPGSLASSLSTGAGDLLRAYGASGLSSALHGGDATGFSGLTGAAGASAGRLGSLSSADNALLQARLRQLQANRSAMMPGMHLGSPGLFPGGSTRFDDPRNLGGQRPDERR